MNPFSPKKPHTRNVALIAEPCGNALPLKIAGGDGHVLAASSGCMTEAEVGHVNSSFSPVSLSRKLDVINQRRASRSRASFFQQNLAVILF